MNVLEIANLTKSYKGKKVIRGISLSVGKGKILAIIGPSGAGKTTLLRCASLLEEAEDGEITLQGETIASSIEGKAAYLPDKELNKARRAIGIVFQSYNLFPHFSVLKNVIDAPLTVLKEDKREAREKAEKLLIMMGLEDKINAYPFELSGGQKQRVAIARALAMGPRVIFFDEPTGALDPQLTTQMSGLMRSLADDGISVVIVTHEMSFARDTADEIIFMENGCIIEQGEARKVIAAPEKERTREFIWGSGR